MRMKKTLPNGDPFDYLLALREGGMKAVYEEEDLELMGEEGDKILNTNVDKEIDICEQIRELSERKIILPRDLRVDDGDIPTAKNFYQWCTEDRFGTIGDERPFLEQLIWGLVTFNEICYNQEAKCTDLEWLLLDHEVDDTFSKLERKVSILENGVCPNCGKGRSEMFAAGYMPFYNELAVNAGQRCVRGSTPVVTADGIMRISEFVTNDHYGFTEANYKIFNGTEIEETSHFFRAAPEPLIRVTTQSGFAIVGTSDHPIMTNEGFLTLNAITPEHVTSIHYGSRQFGKNSLNDPKYLGKVFSDTGVPRTIRTANEVDTTLFLQGLFPEKRRAFMSEIALRDVSAMLLNAGYMHSCGGCTIEFNDYQHELLHKGYHRTGVISESIVSVTAADAEETFDFTLPKTHRFVTGGILSHNSGKSHTLGTYVWPYFNHKMMKLQSPATFYGLSRTTRLQGTFAALTFTQAKDTLWTPFYGAITQTRWYKDYHACLKHYSRVYDEKLFKLNENYVDYRARGLFWHPMSPDMRVMRGRTRIGASIDEIAYFDANKDNQKVTISGHEVYDALANSLATVRTAAENLLNRGYDDIFPAYMMNVTSPVSKADMIHVLLDRSKGSRSMYAVTRATWEVNPNFKRDSQFIKEQFRRDPVSANRNFGAVPPAVANPFITNHKKLKETEGTHKNLIKVRNVIKKSKVAGQGYNYGEITKIKKDGRPSLTAIDAGMVDNSFSIVNGTTDGYNLSINLIAEVMTVPGFRINFTETYDNLILPLMQARNTKVLLADRWNSRMLLDTAVQDMSDMDADDESFIAEQYSLKYHDMVAIRTLIEMGRLTFPRSEIPIEELMDAVDADYRSYYLDKPVAHAYKQMMTIKDLTKTVGKGDGYTDDTWRAIALCCHGLLGEKYELLLSEAHFDHAVAKPSALAASKLYSGGGSAVGKGGGSQTTINGAPLAFIKRN